MDSAPDCSRAGSRGMTFVYHAGLDPVSTYLFFAIYSSNTKEKTLLVLKLSKCGAAVNHDRLTCNPRCLIGAEKKDGTGKIFGLSHAIKR